MLARHEQIGERTIDQQAMSVLRQPAIAHLDKAKHPLDDADRMLDFGPHHRFGTVFRPLGLVYHAAVAVAAVGEVLGLRGMLPDHRALTAIRLIAPHPGLVACNSCGSTTLSATLAGVAITA